jgi:zinc protease
MIRQLFIKICGLSCGWICLTAAAQNIQHWQTPQGVPVYFVQSADVPMVDVRVIFTAGSAYDQNQWGIASLTAGALNEGTKAHNADQIAEALEQTGAQYECDTDRDVTILGLRSLSDSQYLTPALKMFNEIISQANFPDSALSRLKQQTLAAIRQGQQQSLSRSALWT